MSGSNGTQDCYGFQDLCCNFLMWVICGATMFLLLISLSCNILCCARSYRKDNSSKFLPRFRRSFSFKSKEVEDNPVYGNINYLYTGMERGSAGKTVEPAAALKAVTQRQICYAKLTLPASREHRGRKFTKTQYSEVLNTLKGSVSGEEKGKLGAPESRDDLPPGRASPASLDGLSVNLEHSDLYASVRLGRRADTSRSQDYANKESLKIQ